VRIAQAEAQQARLLPNPVLSVAFRFPEAGVGRPVIDAGVTADLLRVLRRPGAISAADAELRAASAAAVSVVLDVATDAQERFYAIQSLEASLGVLRERVQLLARLLELAEARLRIGEGTRLDVVTLQTQSIDLQTQIADREIELRDERLALAHLIGQPSSPATWSVKEWVPVAAPLHSEGAYLAVAALSRPEIQEREWALAALGARRRLAAWDVLGSVDAGAEAERDGGWSVGPALSTAIPLFDFGQASRARAAAAQIEARHELLAIRRQVVEEVRRAYATLVGTQANLDRVLSQLIPLQEARLQQAEAQFRAGQTDITGLLMAEHDLRASKSQLVDLQRRVAIARVRLERAVGGAGALASESATSPSTQPNP
jgi:outer membrane protein TolC